ncbi:hypothetical protein D3C71_1843150 [compost metagenome]
MQALRHQIQNTVFTVRGFTACLLCQERHRVALIQQAQLTLRVTGRAWIEVDPAFQQVAVEVCHQRSDIA